MSLPQEPCLSCRGQRCRFALVIPSSSALLSFCSIPYNACCPPSARLEQHTRQLAASCELSGSCHGRLGAAVGLSPVHAARCVLALGVYGALSEHNDAAEPETHPARRMHLYLTFVWWPCVIDVTLRDLNTALADTGGAETWPASLERAVLVLARLPLPSKYMLTADREVLAFLDAEADALRAEVLALEPQAESDVGFGLFNARVRALVLRGA